VHVEDLVIRWSCCNQISTKVTRQIIESGSWSCELGVRVQQVRVEEFVDLVAMCGPIN